MHKWKAGALKSGGSGKPVKSQKQAVAIMLSEKRQADKGKEEYKSKPGWKRMANS
jgi:parvulin-like peptidyl-prolyl isomerase